MSSRVNKTYRSWSSMKFRCDNKSHMYYDNYGGRGIAYCSRWKNFDNFLEDMGEKQDCETLDRIDNNLNYCKENCRWITRQEQAKNRRSNITLTIDGISKIISEWSKENGAIAEHTIRRRIKRGLDHKTAVFGIGSKKVKLAELGGNNGMD